MAALNLMLFFRYIITTELEAAYILNEMCNLQDNRSCEMVTPVLLQKSKKRKCSSTSSPVTTSGNMIPFQPRNTTNHGLVGYDRTATPLFISPSSVTYLEKIERSNICLLPRGSDVERKGTVSPAQTIEQNDKSVLTHSMASASSLISPSVSPKLMGRIPSSSISERMPTVELEANNRFHKFSDLDTFNAKPLPPPPSLSPLYSSSSSSSKPKIRPIATNLIERTIVNNWSHITSKSRIHPKPIATNILRNCIQKSMENELINRTQLLLMQKHQQQPRLYHWSETSMLCHPTEMPLLNQQGQFLHSQTMYRRNCSNLSGLRRFENPGTRCTIIANNNHIQKPISPIIGTKGELKLCKMEGCKIAADKRTPYCFNHKGQRKCENGNCEKFAQSKTRFCIKHGGGRRCNFPNCTKGARDTVFCGAHGGGKRCTVTSCTKLAVGRDKFCTGHGGGKRCQEQGCPKSAQSSSNFCVRHGGGRKCKVEGCVKAARGRLGVCMYHKMNKLS